MLAVALSAPAANAARTPVFEFGRYGGNILPYTVSIGATGRVVTQGPVSIARRKPLSKTTMRRLLALARTDRFFAMPPSTQCARVRPDAASAVVAITTNHRTTRVSVQGGCNRRFARLFAALNAAVGAR